MTSEQAVDDYAIRMERLEAENRQLRQALESVTNVGDRPAVEVARKALAAISKLVGDVEPRHTAAYDLADDIRVEVDAALAAIKAPASEEGLLECPACQAIHKLHATKAPEEDANR